MMDTFNPPRMYKTHDCYRSTEGTYKTVPRHLQAV